MSLSEKPLIQNSDAIKLAFTFDADRMGKELNSIQLNPFEYYNVIPLRAPAHEVDAALPFPPPAEDYADGSWTEWLDTPTLDRLPYFGEIIKKFSDNTKVTLVRLLRLAPNAVVKEHTDPTLGLEIEKSVIRLTIPIQGTDEVSFFLNKKIVPMQPGECWYLQLTDPHSIMNSGSIERINLAIDMVPNEWMRNVITNAIG